LGYNASWRHHSTKGALADMTCAEADELSTFHRTFDLFYPAIRLVYERVFGNRWFDRITPAAGIPEELWIGGAPTYDRDYAFLLDAGIGAVMNIRAERVDDTALYDAHGIAHIRYCVPDIEAPPGDVLSDGVQWIHSQVRAGRPVLVHCAKGRGRSAAMLAAYLMRYHAMTFDEAADLLRARRKLVKLEDRHRAVLEAWAGALAPMDSRPVTHAPGRTSARGQIGDATPRDA
jgi:hypothetical protein